MKKTLAIGRKEFWHILRDPRSLWMSLLMPMFLLAIYGYALSTDVKNVFLAVEDQDRTALSRQFVESFTSSGYFRQVKQTQDDKSGLDLLLRGDASVILKIPPQFEQKLLKGIPSQVQIIIDGSDANTTSVIAGYIGTVVARFSTGVLAQYFLKLGIPLKQLVPVDNMIRVWYNPELRSTNFLIPGLMVIILMILSVMMPVMSIVGEKERGTFEILITSPIRPLELVVGKIIPYFVIGLFNVASVAGLSVFLFHIPWNGSFGLLMLLSTLFLSGCFGLGVLISTTSNSQQEAMVKAFLVTLLPSFLMSGYIFPISSMPKFIQGFTYLVPARYFMIITRGIFLKGIGLNYLWPQVVFLAVFATLTIIASARAFKKELK